MAVLGNLLSGSYVIISLVFIAIIWLFGLGVYRLYFSPLAKFPGPKLAALTLWYEFYYEVVKRGRYTWKIADLHKQYGPIIRINPYELHIDDPEYYDELYVSGAQRRTMKYSWAMKGFGPMVSAFGTEDHDLHRVRRAAIAPFFSTASVMQLEPTIQANINKLMSRLRDFRGTGSVINMEDMFISLTADIICDYAFASPFGYLDTPDFAPHWRRVMFGISESSHLFKQFGLIEATVRRMPPAIVTKTAPWLASLFSLMKMARDKIIEIKTEVDAGRKPQGQKTIFYDLLTNENLSPQDKMIDRLESEATSIVAAGSVTVAHALSLVCFFLVSDKIMRQKLEKELSSVMDSAGAQPKWVQLQNLPYLTAVTTESLRWGYGVAQRLQRISPDVALRYGEYTIPPGTPVGMSAVLMHDNPDLFPEPRAFEPERWMQPNSAQLRRYVVAFSKGSKQCVGLNLAYCELYLILAALFAPGRFDFELFETDITDVEIYHDFFNPFPRADSKGIRMTVR